MSRNYDLEQRLIKFACKNLDIVERLPASRAGNYFAGQLIRSGNSPAFNYGERNPQNREMISFTK